MKGESLLKLQTETGIYDLGGSQYYLRIDEALDNYSAELTMFGHDFNETELSEESVFQTHDYAFNHERSYYLDKDAFRIEGSSFYPVEKVVDNFEIKKGERISSRIRRIKGVDVMTYGNDTVENSYQFPFQEKVKRDTKRDH